MAHQAHRIQQLQEAQVRMAEVIVQQDRELQELRAAKEQLQQAVRTPPAQQSQNPPPAPNQQP